MIEREALAHYGYVFKLQGAKLECRAPRGSPISPIISILSFCLILWLNDPNVRFGYANDVGILAVSRDTNETTRKLQ